MPFAVIEVPSDAATLTEQLGTKPKFWYADNQYLFKENRPGTGEDWSEKVACELCQFLGIPHATYELAVCREKRGVVTETFVPSGAQLVLGNELLARVVPGYPTRLYRVHEHTLSEVLGIAGGVRPPIGFTPFADVQSAADVFLGYLMIDGWIANQDRHHENWGVISVPHAGVHLAPSFDHASSLGRIETDDEKRERLTTRDQGRTVERYVQKGASAFYDSPTSPRPLSTVDAFMFAARLHPRAALNWLRRLEEISLADAERVFRSIPSDRISEVSIEFGLKILSLNRRRLLDCVPELRR
jgi:hypothetical protein